VHQVDRDRAGALRRTLLLPRGRGIPGERPEAQPLLVRMLTITSAESAVFRRSSAFSLKVANKLYTVTTL